MISDVKVDLSVMKAILLGIIEQYKYLLFDNEENLLKVLIKEYEPTDTNDVTRIKAYRMIFSDFYVSLKLSFVFSILLPAIFIIISVFNAGFFNSGVKNLK